MNDNNMYIYEKWSTIIKTQMHFNEMIIRLRTVGLSLVITIMGAGFYLGFNKTNNFTLSKTLFIIVLSLIILVILHLVIRAIRKKSFSKVKRRTEKGLLWIIIIIPTIFLFYFAFYIENPILIPMGSIISASGIVLLFSLYLLDRFYYYELLVGAVKEGREFESGLDVSLSEKLTECVNEKEAGKIVTLYYCLPAICGITIIFLWILSINL